MLQRTLMQARLEQRAFWRNPDYAFFTFVLPIGLLLILGTVNSGDELDNRAVEAIVYFVPGILAFGVIVATYANLATRVAVLRSEGVLKRIRATPISPVAYLCGHLVSALVTAVLIGIATIGLGAAVFDVVPRADAVPVLALVLPLGISCFAALALAISSVIASADAAGPVTNATYLPLAIVSGVFDPTLTLPSWIERVVSLFPVRAMSASLQSTYDPIAQPVPYAEILVLVAWASFGMLLALRYFRWEP